jgi:hypothetical protein
MHHAIASNQVGFDDRHIVDANCVVALWLGSKCSKRQKRVSECIDLDQFTHLARTHQLFVSRVRFVRPESGGWDPSAESDKTAVSDCIDLGQLLHFGPTHLDVLCRLQR